jgi:hypothetical protein
MFRHALAAPQAACPQVLAALAAIAAFGISAAPSEAGSYLFERSYYSHAPAKPVEVTPRVPAGGPQFTRPQGFAAQGMVRRNYSRIVVRGRTVEQTYGWDGYIQTQAKF